MKVDAKSEQPTTDGDAKAATGRGWDEWYRLLDESGGPAPGRRAITERLVKEFSLTPWWAQTIAVEYEAARGLREKDGRPKGYAICVTKAIAAPVEHVFDAFGDPAVMCEWLGAGATASFEEGSAFSTADGNRGRYTKAARPKTLRFVWEDDDPAAVSSVELKLTPNGARTALVLNHERIQSRALADGLRAAWGGAIERLKRKLESSYQLSAISSEPSGSLSPTGRPPEGSKADS